MKNASLILLSLLCAACSGMGTGMGGATAQEQSSRNLCESMRSYQPYRPGDCPGYGMRSDGRSRWR